MVRVGLPTSARNVPGYLRMKKGLRVNEFIKRAEELARFKDDLAILKSNFKTESTKFMFPTIMCRYRRGMNPVRGIYYELQKTLFQFDKDNPVHIWIITLFHNKEWYRKLIEAIAHDYFIITKFQQAHLPQFRNKHIERELSVLNNVKENLLHYKEVFSLMSDQLDRYLK
jgi:hypothetical protein